MEEEWRAVVGYEGLYEVSNTGKVRSLDRYVQQKNMYKIITHIYHGRELSLKKHRDGYLVATLCKNKGLQSCQVHRIVATAFIPNPNELPQINHKDENKQNNNVNNLEWCTSKYNNNYGTRSQRMANTQRGRKHSEETKRKMSENRKGKCTGENNPMYGKHHSKETRQRLREITLLQWENKRKQII